MVWDKTQKCDRWRMSRDKLHLQRALMVLHEGAVSTDVLAGQGWRMCGRGASTASPDTLANTRVYGFPRHTRQHRQWSG